MGGGHSALKKARECEKAATRMYAYIDKDAKGFVNKGDLITQMERYGHDIHSEWQVKDIEKVIQKYGNKNGTLTL